MSYIIGNQDKEKKSKIDTEKWKEHREYYNDPRNKKPKTQAYKDDENLELRLLTYDLLGKPVLRLTTLARQWVTTPTQEEYDTLMQIYEAGGWKWDEILKTPTEYNAWLLSKTETCIRAENSFDWQNKDVLEIGTINILSNELFYKVQNITPEMLKELNQWYDKHQSSRASKG